jgi:hypothetical protein
VFLNLIRFVNIPPAKIQVGDIVELQVLMTGVPMRNGDYKLSTILRGVTLMDGSHTQVQVITMHTYPYVINHQQ